ncbi:SurA N-terminal domain-containing protein [Parasutterella secunda]|uniref:SurA N-terminal domain-containing protein n=1 Tax=Parasutterella secunda TaxID=626947 RepID=UPI0021AC807E|nr:SurA N-terminal domain-containing protein [Parasutterella secunda]MCR8919528.1 SurA N-terminal domain-containing protein [Parasutterella secunda]MDM8226518.1 SurA N-terminal domain-containing protein [Parasutterella secunda]
MLQAFRTHKRWMMFIAMIFIIPSFVVTGIYSYNRMSDSENDLATVGDTSITMMDFDNAKRQYLDNFRRQMGQSFKPNMLDTAEARASILAALISDRAISLEIASEYMNVGEADAINLVKQAPAFQRDGKFSTEAYQQFLNSMGKSDEQFVLELRRDLTRQMLLSAVSQTTQASNTVAQRIHDLLTEERTIRTFEIKPTAFLKSVSVTDAEAQSYYDQNKSLFAVPESVDIEYVVLSPESYKNIKASEDDIKTFYEQNLQRFSTPEERRASHILIAVNNEKTDADAKKEADEIYKQLQADPSKFAQLAKSKSADPGSARQGGDLGFFQKGMMVPEFDNAVFSGKKGDLVAPVKTQFGYHIIKIVDVKPAQAKPLKEVRGEIEALYQQQAAIRAFAEDAENFSNMVYEQSESLQPVAERFGLKIQTVKNVTRDFEDQLINPNVIEALYGFDVLEDKRNSNAIEVASNTLLSARVTAHHKQTVKTFDEVKGDIVATLKNQKATEAARAQGSADIAKLLDKKSASGKFGDKTVISRERPGAYAYEVVTAALRPDANKLPTYTGVQTQDGSYFVIEVQSSKKIEASPEQLAMRKAELAQLYSNPEQAAFISGLETKFGTQILKDEYKPGYQPTDEDVAP